MDTTPITVEQIIPTRSELGAVITWQTSTFGPIEASAIDGATRVRLHPPMLRGSEPGVTIRYQLGTGAHYDLSIYNASGRLLRVLDRGFAQGERLVTWDGTTEAGASAPRGTYFVRLRSDHGTDAEKLLHLRR